MSRIFWFLAGCVAGYVLAGYVDGLNEETENSSTNTENTTDGKHVLEPEVCAS